METRIRLNKWKPREYQIPIIDAIENKGFKKVLVCLPRRAGKDVTAWNIAIRQCLEKTRVVYYIFPTYAQAKKAIFDSVTIDGERFLDFIPKEVIASINSTNMAIRFKNDSLLQLIGSDNPDSIRGTNPYMCVFSEYSRSDSRMYTEVVRPILRVNDGIALFVSTPNGMNHFYDLYQIALNNEDWFCYKLSVEETSHISLRDIEKEKADGLISEDMIQQEYYCSFQIGVEGAYYAKYIDRMRLKGHIGDYSYETRYPVHTSWDLGIKDQTTILFFQVINNNVHIIDTYENNGHALAHYAKILDQKGYKYGKHIAPHDIEVREIGSGISRKAVARDLGIDFMVAKKVDVEDGIEIVRTTFDKLRIDAKNCTYFIKCIENYRQEYDSRRQAYKGRPLHDFSSHWADTLRYLCISLPRLQPGMTPEQLEAIRNEAFGFNRHGNFFDGNTAGLY